MIDRAAVVAAIAAIEPGWLADQRWFGGKGRTITSVGLAEAFALDDRAALAIVRVSFVEGPRRRFSVAFVADPVLRIAEPGDGAWRALALAALEGRVIPALAASGDASESASASASASGGSAGPVSGALVCRPSGRLAELLGRGEEIAERGLGVDQSNTSIVLSERIVLKAFRGIETGLEPDLELTAFLSEEVGFGAVPALAGSVELVSAADGVATVALLTEYVTDATDGYESTAEELTAWMLAPGQVAVEFATEDAEDLGTLTAALHAALASRLDVEGFEVRSATRDELRAWRANAEAGLRHAVDVTEGDPRDRLRAAAPEIAARLSVHEAMTSPPIVMRVHGDLHLGQVMRSSEGWRIIDFEGEPARPLDDRRRHTSPLRDVASMLRSLHHVGLSARRRAEERSIERGTGPLTSPGLDLESWLRRSRERFLIGYRQGLRHAGATRLDVDDELLHAFELEKAAYEFVYAATYLPNWTEIALGGLEGLLGWAAEGGR